MNKLPKFYVGQKVVAIVSDEFISKGKEYTVLGISKAFCDHGDFDVNIGITAAIEGVECLVCGKILFKNSATIWHPQNEFAPIHEDFQAITFSKVLEEKLLSVN